MNPLHFDGLVWHWPIAIYLFLAGISAGAICFAVLLKRYKLGKDAYKSKYVIAACLIAPLAVWGGLGVLVIDLTKPFDFWKILVFYNPTSIMSIGVAILMVYQAALFLWFANLFGEPISNWCNGRWPIVNKVLSIISRHDHTITGILVILALSLGAYTGFLLAALTTYPMLNNPVLPMLFLVSGISSGGAGTLLLGLLLKGDPDAKEVHFIHNLEIPLILLEIAIIFAFFIGLIVSGGQSYVAAMTAIGGGFWAWVFWVGIVFFGLTVPLAMNLFMTASYKRKLSYVAVTAACSLMGVILLRNFILYAGQMTLT